MFSISSSRALLLGILFFLFANQTVQSAFIEILPEAKQDEQVIEVGSTLTLTCLEMIDQSNRNETTEIKWTIPRKTNHKEVKTKFNLGINSSVCFYFFSPN